MQHQSLQVRQQQQLVLTPQLQQSIRFLQLSTQDLEAELAQVLQDNPMLERQDDDVVASEALPDARDDEASLSADVVLRSRAPEDDDFRPEASQPETLRDHLLWQLHTTRIAERVRALATLLIEDLDDNGYLPMSLEEFAVCLPPALDIDLGEIQCALRLVQSFDPVGVGARNLSECLLLQLHAGVAGLPQNDPAWQCACEIVRHHLDVLASGNVKRLCAMLSADRAVVLAAHAVILRLEPKPARNWAVNVAETIRPDVLVRKRDGRWQASLNPFAQPRLRVNPQYESWLVHSGGDHPLRREAQQAHAVIRSLQQRGNTMLRVAQEIVARQYDFFDAGAHAMRPLRLRDIAQTLALHESTVSRATKRKYLQAHGGVFELKYFFTTAVLGSDGEDVTTLGVQSMLAKLVADEAPHTPLSDSQLAAHLMRQGINVARRTVAKYREAMGIGTAQQRKAKADRETV